MLPGVFIAQGDRVTRRKRCREVEPVAPGTDLLTAAANTGSGSGIRATTPTPTNCNRPVQILGTGPGTIREY